VSEDIPRLSRTRRKENDRITSRGLVILRTANCLLCEQEYKPESVETLCEGCIARIVRADDRETVVIFNKLMKGNHV